MFSRKRVYFQRKTKMFMKDVFERKCFEFSVVLNSLWLTISFSARVLHRLPNHKENRNFHQDSSR